MEKLPIPQRITEIFTRTKELQKSLSGLRRNLETEKQNILDYSRQIEKLEDSASTALSGGGKKYEQWKARMKEVSDKLISSKEFTAKLPEIMRPLDKELKANQFNIQIMLMNYITEYRRQADEEISALLDSLMGQIESFLSNCKQIYADFGLVFLENPNLIPGRIPWEFITEYRERKTVPLLCPVEQPETKTGSTHKTEVPVPVEVQAPSPELLPEDDSQPEPLDAPPTPAEPIAEPFGEPEPAVLAESEAAAALGD